MATEGHSLLEEGDIEEAMRAAKSIGDDALQRQSDRIRPDSFTHGTSEQRLRWSQIWRPQPRRHFPSSL